MTPERFVELLKYVGKDGEVPYSYSGRFMYGARCVAINVERNASAFSLLAGVALAAELDNEGDGDDVVRILDDTRQDSMGLDTVLYWPRLKWDGKEEFCEACQQHKPCSCDDMEEDSDEDPQSEG